MAISPPCSIIRPVRQTTPDVITAIVQRAGNNAASIVRAVAGIADIVTRDLNASDVYATTTGRMTNPTALVANTVLADAFTSFSLNQTQALAIYGYVALSASPQIDQVSFSVGSSATYAILPLGSLYDEQVATAIFEPIYFQPNEHINVSLLTGLAAGVAQYAETFMLLGVIAEQAGFRISSPREVVGGFAAGA